MSEEVKGLIVACLTFVVLGLMGRSCVINEDNQRAETLRANCAVLKDSTNDVLKAQVCGQNR